MFTLLALLGFSLLGLGTATLHLTGNAEAAFPPKGQFITIEGRRMHVQRRSPEAAPEPAQPVVFIHGAFGAGEDFMVSVIPALADRFDCIAIDRPGHGYSDRHPAGQEAALTPAQQAEILRATLAAMNVSSKPILVGFSLGAAVALAWALDYPDEIAGLLLINPASHPWPTPIETSYRLAGTPGLGPLMLHTVVAPVGRLLLDQGAAKVFSPAEVPEHYRMAPVALSVRPASFAANAEDIRILKPFLQQQSVRYPALQVPLLILASDEDQAASPLIHARPLAAQVPDAELREVTGGGHPLHFSRPAEVIAALQDLAGRLAAR